MSKDKKQKLCPKHRSRKISTITCPENLSADEELYFADPFQDGKFANPWGVEAKPTPLNLAKWKAQKNPFAQEKKQQALIGVAPNPLGVFEGLPPGMKVLWLGHASFLIEIEGLSILLDPVFGDIPLTSRKVAAPISPQDIPEVDVLLLSHGHFDHLDVSSLKAIGSKFGEQSLSLVPSGLAPLIPDTCGEVLEFSWWQSIEVKGLRFTLVPAQHWHGRGPGDLQKCLWGGWVIEGSERRIFFSGDSGYCKGFSLIGKIFSHFDLALLPLGSFEPTWMMGNQHMNPSQALDVFEELNADHFIGLHWGAFDLSDEPMDYGIRLLDRLVAERGFDASRFHKLTPGGSLAFDGDEIISTYTCEDMLRDRLQIPGTIFEGASEREMQLVSETLHPLTVAKGETIFSQDDKGDSLLYLLNGRVQVERSGTILAEVGPGGIVGEMAPFIQELRSANVQALEDSDVLLLHHHELQSLRKLDSAIAWRLERILIGSLTHRMRSMIEQIKEEISSADEDSEISPTPSFMSRLKSLLVSSPAAEDNARLDVSEALFQSGLFGNEDDLVMKAVGKFLRQENYRSGTYLCRQGETGEDIYFIAEGTVEVQVSLGSTEGPLKVAQTGPGEALGLMNLIDRQGCSADCVTISDVTTFNLDRSSWFKLYDQNDLVGSVMRLAIIRGLCKLLSSSSKYVVSKQNKHA